MGRLLRQQRSLPAGREEDASDLEEPDVGEAMGVVVRDGAEEPGKDPGAQDGLLGAERIGRLDEPVERRAGPFEIGRRHERDRDGLGQPGADERVGDARAARAAPRGEHADLLAGPRHGATDGLEPDSAGDLLDDVDLALEVGAERRSDRGDVVGTAVHFDARTAGARRGSPSRAGRCRARR